MRSAESDLARPSSHPALPTGGWLGGGDSQPSLPKAKGLQAGHRPQLEKAGGIIRSYFDPGASLIMLNFGGYFRCVQNRWTLLLRAGLGV